MIKNHGLRPVLFDKSLFPQLNEKQIEYIENLMHSQYETYKNGLDEFEKQKNDYKNKISKINEKKQLIIEKEYQKRKTMDLKHRIDRERKLVRAFVDFSRGFKND